MQCSNCDFFNIPGSAHCGRCGSPLGLRAAAVSVMPPRASPMRKRLRRVFPVQRIYLRAAHAAHATDLIRLAPGRSLLLFFLWCTIPGLPHFAGRQPVRAHLFLWGFLVTLLAGLVLMGSTWGSIFIGLAFSVHSSAIADLINQRFPDATVGRRMFRGLAVSAVLFAAVYWPAGMLIGQVAAPYQLEVALSPFQVGDVVIASSARPRVGNVVLYEVPNSQAGVVRREGHRYRVLEGRNIDRILAGPGDIVEGRGGMLFVNGVPGKSLPLNPLTFPADWKQTVSDGTYLILPSDNADLLDNAANWGLLGFVAADAIVGRIYLRSQPWNRFSIIH